MQPGTTTMIPTPKGSQPQGEADISGGTEEVEAIDKISQQLN
jgi:hypothetical protein